MTAENHNPCYGEYELQVHKPDKIPSMPRKINPKTPVYIVLVKSCERSKARSCLQPDICLQVRKEIDRKDNASIPFISIPDLEDEETVSSGWSPIFLNS